MDPESALKALPRALGVKVGMLLAATILIAGGFVLYVLFARGTFEHTQRLYLIAGDVEGVAIGMNITFSGFPVGRVRRISLGADGKAKIEIDVREDDAKWLRTSSVFTLERGLVGGAKIRAYSGNLQDPPLPDGAVRPVLRGDTAEEVPQLVATARGIPVKDVQAIASKAGLDAPNRLGWKGRPLRPAMENVIRAGDGEPQGLRRRARPAAERAPGDSLVSAPPGSRLFAAKYLSDGRRDVPWCS